MTFVDVLDDGSFKVIKAAHSDETLRVLSAVSGVHVVIPDVEMPRGSFNGFEEGSLDRGPRRNPCQQILRRYSVKRSYPSALKLWRDGRHLLVVMVNRHKEGHEDAVVFRLIVKLIFVQAGIIK